MFLSFAAKSRVELENSGDEFFHFLAGDRFDVEVGFLGVGEELARLSSSRRTLGARSSTRCLGVRGGAT